NACGIGHGCRAGGVQADRVALDEVPRRETELNFNADRVPRDEVPRTRGRAADGISRAEDVNAQVVADGRAPGDVGADEIAFDRVRLRGAVENDAVVGVGGDD